MTGKPNLKEGPSSYAVSDWLFEHRLARQLAGNRTMTGATVKCMKVDVYEIKQEMDSNPRQAQTYRSDANDDRLEKEM